MKPSDVFGIVVRTFGLYLIIWGLWNILSLAIEVVSLLAALINDESLDLLTKLYYLLSGTGATLVGFFLLARADAVVRWAYRHDRPVVLKPPAPPPRDPTDPVI
ncbi:MAG TPA: hypothetical protein PKC67_10020 [Kiritimatiellia bacterium]|nr:hypothetical protein [Kiritimatiellia bacterium]HMP34674.1 hypothetical protein [Kiritimatiellia bacterium]